MRRENLRSNRNGELNHVYDTTAKVAQTKTTLSTLLSGATADIVLLFRNKPYLVLTQQSIAVKIGMKTEPIGSDLRELVNLGLLKSRKIGAQTWFSLNKKRDKQIQAQIREYIRSFGEDNYVDVARA